VLLHPTADAPMSGMARAAFSILKAGTLLLGFGLLYGGAVLAARAVIRAERRASGGTPFFNAASLVFSLILSLPIGVWFLRPRLARLCVESPS
jgi:hypothetical protein